MSISTMYMLFKIHFNSHVQTSHCYSLLEVTVIACATLDAGFLPRKLEIKLPASSSFVRSTPYTTKKTLTSRVSARQETAQWIFFM